MHYHEKIWFFAEKEILILAPQMEVRRPQGGNLLTPTNQKLFHYVKEFF